MTGETIDNQRVAYPETSVPRGLADDGASPVGTGVAAVDLVLLMEIMELVRTIRKNVATLTNRTGGTR